VILKLTGDLTVSQGQYTFVGTISAPPDPYDFDKRPWGERTYAGKTSTRGGAMLPGKPFNNVFNGNKPINTGGMLSPFCCVAIVCALVFWPVVDVLGGQEHCHRRQPARIVDIVHSKMLGS
jgi:hypothetical protein